MDQESSGVGGGQLQVQEEAAAAMAKEGGGKKARRGKQQQRRKRRQEQEREYRLVSYEELPEYMKENEFILRHYRSEWPLLHAFLSVFSWHNETINIWTHLLGFFLFLGLTVWHLAQYFPQVAHLIGHLSWPISKVAENVSSNIGDVLSDQHSILHDDADSSRQEIEKHLVANFSVLELHLKTEGHDFGAFVIQLLGIDRIRCATRRLKVILHRSAMKGGCQPPCPC